jgi:transposase
LLPAEEVDAIVPVKPRRCRRCGGRLHGVDAAPRRHQVTELPRVRPQVTEYQLHTLSCAHCGEQTPAAWPAGMPAGAFGPRLEATVAVCTGVYHLSRRTTVGLMADLFGTALSLGTVSACEQAVSAAVAGPVADAHAYVQQQEVVHADETGWRQRRQRAWLWVMVSALVTVFMVHRRRGTDAARALLGDLSRAVSELRAAGAVSLVESAREALALVAAELLRSGKVEIALRVLHGTTHETGLSPSEAEESKR